MHPKEVGHGRGYPANYLADVRGFLRLILRMGMPSFGHNNIATRLYERDNTLWGCETNYANRTHRRDDQPWRGWLVVLQREGRMFVHFEHRQVQLGRIEKVERVERAIEGRPIVAVAPATAVSDQDYMDGLRCLGTRLAVPVLGPNSVSQCGLSFDV